MPDLAELNIKIHSQEVKEAESHLKKLGETAEHVEEKTDALKEGTAKLGEALAHLIEMIGGAIAATGLLGIAFEAVKKSAEFEQISQSFEALTGNISEAKELLEGLEKIRTPFDIENITQAGKQMLVFGFAAKDVIPTVTIIADAMADLGKSGEDVDEIVSALGRVNATGKITSREMLMLTRDGIQAWKYLSESIGESVAKTQELVNKEEISGKQAIRAILDGLQHDFAGGQAEAVKRLAGGWQDFKNQFNITMREIGDTLVQAFDLHGVLLKVREGFDEYKESILEVTKAVLGLGEAHSETLQRIADLIRAVGAAVAVITVLSTLVTTLKLATLIIGAMGSPITLTILAVASLVAAIVYFKDTMITVGNRTATVWDYIKSTAVEAWNGVKMVWSGLSEFFNTLWEGIKATFSDAVDGFRSNFESMFGEVGFDWQDFCQAFGDTFLDTMNHIIAGFKSMMEVIRAGIKETQRLLDKAEIVNFYSALTSKSTPGQQAQDIINYRDSHGGKEPFEGLIDTDPKQKAARSLEDLTRVITEETWSQAEALFYKAHPERAGFQNSTFSKDLDQALLHAGTDTNYLGAARKSLQDLMDRIGGRAEGYQQERTNGAALRALQENLKLGTPAASVAGGGRGEAGEAEVSGPLVEKIKDQTEALELQTRALDQSTMAKKLNAEMDKQLYTVNKIKDPEQYDAAVKALDVYIDKYAEYLKMEQEVSMKNKTQDADIQLKTIGMVNDARGVEVERLKAIAYGVDENDEVLNRYIATLRKLVQITREWDLEQMNRDLDDQFQLLGKNAEEQVVLRAKADLVKKGWDANSTAVQQYLGRVRELEHRTELIDLANNIGAAFTSAFDDMIFGAKSASEAIRNLALAIEKMILDQAVMKPLQNLISGGFGSLLTLGSSTAAATHINTFVGPPAPSAYGNIFPMAIGGVVDQPTYFPMHGGTGLMGEAGPEAVVPLARDKDGRLGIRGGGGKTVVQNVTIHVHTPNADSFRKSHPQIAAELKRAAGGGFQPRSN